MWHRPRIAAAEVAASTPFSMPGTRLAPGRTLWSGLLVAAKAGRFCRSPSLHRLGWALDLGRCRASAREFLRYAVLAALLPSAAWAAAKRAMGTRNGEQET
jgi:hypothetical protein